MSTNNNQSASSWLADYAAGQAGAPVGSGAGQLGAATRPIPTTPTTKSGK